MQKKQTIENPEMLDGPMMEYKEWSIKETKEFADYVSARKATDKAQKHKIAPLKIPINNIL